MRRFLARNRTELAFGAALLVVATAFAATGLAGSIGNDPSLIGTLDGYQNFSIVDTNNPASAPGRITKIDYYAGATLPMAFIVVSATNTVKYVGDTITPPDTGLQTWTPPPSWLVQSGDNIGMYFAQTGVIPFTTPGDPAVWEPQNSGKPTVGETLTIEGGWPPSVTERTYSFVATVLEPTTTCSSPAKSYAGWAAVQSVYVPANDADGVAGPASTDGIAYKVESSGFWYAQGGPRYPADAEFSLHTDGTGSETVWEDAAEEFGFDNAGNDLLDLRINGAFITWTTTFAPDHVYTYDVLGTGTPATFGLGVDENEVPGWFGDNTGGLCVTVFEDDLAPVVSDVTVTPSMVKSGSTVAITATADDTTKNGSDIASASFSVNGGSWQPMTVVDGTPDEPSEAFSASFTNVPAGIHEVCVKATDRAGNVTEPAVCAELKVYDRWAKVSGVVVGTSGDISSTGALNVPTDKGEPDWTFDGYAYAGGADVWGSVHVNYKSIAGGPVSCTFTPGTTGTFVAYGGGARPRVDLSGWTAACSDGTSVTASIQLLPRETTSWGDIVSSARASFPRGGVFLNGQPYGALTGPFDLFSGLGAFDLWVPLDRGNVHTWADASVPRS